MVERITREKALSISSMIFPMKARVLSAVEGASFYVHVKEGLLNSYFVLAILDAGNLWVSDESYREIFEEYIAENGEKESN